MLIVGSLTGMILAAGFCIGKSDSYMEIGQEELLFLNDYVIDRTENITRRINQALKHGEPVIWPDLPWEENRALIFGTALYNQDAGIFRMWYYCGGGHVAYAESADGINWQKPELDVVVRDGKKTNIVIERGNFGHFYEIFGVLKDNKDPDPSRRYKMAFLSIQRDYHGEYEDPYHSKPLIFRGPQLFINANAEFGSIQVTLLDDQENQIPGWQSTISGEDNIRIPVNFEQSSVADLADRCIRIQFVLKNAQISGFCVQ